MQRISESDRVLLSAYSRISFHAYLGSARLDIPIRRIWAEYSCGDGESFSFGNACAANIRFELSSAVRDLKGRALRLTWSVSGAEYPFFSGKISDAKISAGQTTVEAWDQMYFGGSDAFVPKPGMSSDMDAWEAFSFLASAMGTEVDQAAMQMLRGVTIAGGLSHLAETSSNSAVAGYIAGLIGGNAIMDRLGRLTVRQFADVGFSTQPYSGEAIAAEADFVVSGITFQKEADETEYGEGGTSSENPVVYEYGAGDGSLLISNPLADQQAADRAFGELEGLRIRPGSFTFPGGIELDPGDVISIRSMDGVYQVSCAMISMSIDGGVRTTVVCGGRSPQGGAQGPLNQALATLIADFAQLRTLIADNARIVNARIDNLTVDDIAAGRIHSTDFEVDNLDMLYPDEKLYPSDDLFPNNGEEIVRGFEIDFESGVIRGVFWHDDIADLGNKVTDLQNQMADIQTMILDYDGRIARLEALAGISGDI